VQTKKINDRIKAGSILAGCVLLTGCGAGPAEPEVPVYPPQIGAEHEAGRTVWINYCKLCHEDGGEDDAPILGDREVWKPRLEKSLSTLYTSVIEGKGYMPARAGKKELTDESIQKAVNYMVEASR
ncbi:MAG: c-type cytochrome, partial [Verrucomicrobiota bacterium]